MSLRGIVSGLFVASLFSAVPAFGDEAPHVFTTAQQEAVAAIAPERMKATIDFLASDELGGRIPGSAGHKVAREWICDRVQALGLEPAGSQEGSYFHTYRGRSVKSRFERLPGGEIVPHRNDEGWNVVGILRGSDPEFRDEYIVYLAHYDHTGVTKKGEVFNGAFDNAGGVAAGLEVAEVLSREGARPKRSVVFLFSDEEESGLRGARAWAKKPTVPKDDIVFAISGDPLGRRIVPDYGAIILSGLERSPSLLAAFRETTSFAESDVAFVHRGVIPGFASDQDTFHDEEIPAAWFINPGMTYYHTVDDTADTIDYRIMLDDARYLARTLLLLGGNGERYAYEGEVAMGAEAARDAKVLIDGLLGSESLTWIDRVAGRRLQKKLGQVVEAGNLDPVMFPQAFFISAVAYIFAVGKRHPGAIPPPFPADEPRDGAEGLR